MQLPNKALKPTLIPNKDLCYWELSQNTSYWSSAFISELGYNFKDVYVGLNFF